MSRRMTSAVLAAAILLPSTLHAAPDLNAEIGEGLVKKAMKAADPIAINGQWKFKKKKKFLGITYFKAKITANFQFGLRKLDIDLVPNGVDFSADLFADVHVRGKASIIVPVVSGSASLKYAAPMRTGLDVLFDPKTVSVRMSLRTARLGPADIDFTLKMKILFIPVFLKLSGKKINLFPFDLARFFQPIIVVDLPVDKLRNIKVPVPDFTTSIAGGQLKIIGFTKTFDVVVVNPSMDITSDLIRVTSGIDIIPK